MNEPSLTRAFTGLLRRDLILMFRHRAEIANPLVFFVIVVTLVPLGVGSDPAVLSIIAPGIIWVAALLAALLSLDAMFRADYEDGALEQILLSPHPIGILVIAKVIAHWLLTGVPLILLAPVLGNLLALPSQAMGVLVITLLLGTPVLSFVGAIGVALTVGLRRGGVLLSLLVLPLYIPVLIFAANAVGRAAVGDDVTGPLYLLGAVLVLSITLAPVATGAALRISSS